MDTKELLQEILRTPRNNAAYSQIRYVGSQMTEEEQVQFLKGLLAHGPVLSTVVLEKAKAAGIAERTLNRAKQHLGIQSDRVDGKWHWHLPEGGA